MIVGNGDIAKVLIDRDDRLYFASGVSNSLETRESEYQREIDLLLQQNRHAHIVYFSSLCIFYANTPYAMHKRVMEGYVKAAFLWYTIVRVGNISWGTNPHTLINTLRENLRKEKPLEVRDAYRYIVDASEFLHWINLIPDWNCEMNITGQPMKVSEVVKKYVL